MTQHKAGVTKPPREMYSDWMPQLIKSALIEVLGMDALNKLLVKASLMNRASKDHEGHDISPELDPNTIQAVLVELYGCQSGSGLAIQIGRICFQNLIRQHATELGFSNMSFRLLPLSRKIDKGSEILAPFISHGTHRDISWEQSEHYYIWKIHNSKIKSKTITSNPVCMLVRGILQEAFYWMSSGRTFVFQEKCSHLPDAQKCTIQVEKKPLD